MVRNYKRKTEIGRYNESIQQALDLVVSGLSHRKAAAQCNVAHSTLSRYVNKRISGDGSEKICMSTNNEGRRIFTSKQEAILSAYILYRDPLFNGLTKDECRQVAYHIARINKIKYPEEWNYQAIAGIEWFINFMKRHPELNGRRSKGCKSERPFKFNKTNIKKYFKKTSLKKLHQIHNGENSFQYNQYETDNLHELKVKEEQTDCENSETNYLGESKFKRKENLIDSEKSDINNLIKPIVKIEEEQMDIVVHTGIVIEATYELLKP